MTDEVRGVAMVRREAQLKGGAVSHEPVEAAERITSRERACEIRKGGGDGGNQARRRSSLERQLRAPTVRLLYIWIRLCIL